MASLLVASSDAVSITAQYTGTTVTSVSVTNTGDTDRLITVTALPSGPTASEVSPAHTSITLPVAGLQITAGSLRDYIITFGSA